MGISTAGAAHCRLPPRLALRAAAFLAIAATAGAFDRASADEATLRYVSDRGENRADCTLPVRPCRTVQYALSVAGKTDQVRVASGTYEIASLDDAAYLVHGSVAVRGGFDRFDHFLTHAPERNPTTLVGVPMEFRDRLRAQGFHVIVDRKGLDSEQREALAAMSTSDPNAECASNRAGSYACDQVDLLSHVALGDMAARPTGGADIWGFADLNTGREYALIGVRNGLAAFDVTDARAPFEVGHVSTNLSSWRDAKVLQRYESTTGRWRSYAYVSSESGGKLIVVDLTGLPNRIALGQIRSEAAIHNVLVSNVEPATGIPLDATGAPPLLYTLGGYDNSGGFVAYRLDDPSDPTQTALSTGGYSHDAAAMIVTDARRSACGSVTKCPVLIDFNEDTFDLYDVSNASSPRRLSSTTYGDVGYVHSGWPTEDGRHLFVHDELDEARRTVSATTVRVFSLASLTSPSMAGSWSGSTAAIDHNGIVRGNRYYMATYTRGLTVLDITDPTAPTRAGYFDTYTTNDLTRFSGAWGVYPFLPSGNLLVSDIAGGLYVLGDETRASESGTIGFTAATFAGQEGNSVSVSVSRSDGTSGAVSVHYTVIPASASAADLTVSSGTLSWAADEDGERSIAVSLTGDNVAEGLEFALVRLTSPAGGAVLADTSMATVFVGDAGAATTLGFAESSISVEERAGFAVATVRRMGSASGAVSVEYAAHAGTAAETSDYVAPGGSQLSWADGDATPRTIVVAVVSDSVEESAEQFEIRLSAATGATLSSAATVTVQINADAAGVDLSEPDITLDEGDNDGYTIALRTRPSGIVAVELTPSGDSDVSVSPAALTFGTADWNAPRRVVVDTGPDEDIEDDSATIRHVLSGGGYDAVSTDLPVTVRDRSVPGPVTGLRVLEEVESLLVWWTAMPGADGYRVQWKSGTQEYNAGDRQATVMGDATTSHEIPNLTAGQQHHVRVSAFRTSVSDGPPSTERSGTPRTSAPGRVTGLAVDEAVQSLSLSWTAAADADGYKVQWKSAGQGYSETDRQRSVSTAGDTLPGLTPGTEYTVRVKATRRFAISDGLPSEERRGTPTAPAAGQVGDIIVAGDVRRLLVSWGTVVDADGYRVQWKSAAQEYNETDRQRTVSGGSATSYAIGGLTPGLQYEVRVIARRDHAPEGLPSAEASGTPTAAQPGAPQGLSVTAKVEGLVLSWRPVTDVNGYKVQWKSGGQDYDEVDHQRSVADNTTSYSIEELEPGTEYTVRVKATRDHAAEDGAPSVDRAGTPLAERPGQVTGIAVRGAAASLIVSWNPVSGADGYRVQWRSGSESYNATDRQAAVPGEAMTAYTIPSLLSGTVYTARVKAANAHAVEEGPPSEERDGAPTAADAQAAPRLESVVVVDTEIVLTYDRPLNASFVPASGDFSVAVASRGNVDLLRVAIDGPSVRLTLRDGVTHGERTTVTYTPGATPLRSAAGTAAAALAGETAVETIVSMAPVRVPEGEVAVFRAVLSRAVAEAFSIDWATADGTARAGADYTGARSGSLIVPSGKNEVTVEVATVQDRLREGDEVFTVSLSEPADHPFWAMLQDAAVVATVVDDDGSATSGSAGGSGGGGSGGSGGGGSGGGGTGGGGGGGGGGGSVNRPPVITQAIADQTLEVSDSIRLDASEHFRDPERRTVEFDAESADETVAAATVDGSVVTIRGVAHGVTMVTVTATDQRRAQASQAFAVSVGYELSFEETALFVPEGDRARLAVAFNRAREVSTTVRYSVGVDADATTSDADDADYDGVAALVVLEAGQREAVIEIPVHDDGDIEPPRESFAVTLLQSPEQLQEFSIGVATATVTITEGVCDRTVQVRNAVRRSLPCTAVSAEDLAGVRVLSLPRRDVAALRALDLSGLTGLRKLDLSENGLVELPAGLFAGLTALREVHLQGNPGAPFRLTLQLARTDAAVTVPGPATVVTRVAPGAPFVLRTGVSAVNGGASVDMVSIATGGTEGTPFVVAATAGAVRVTLHGPPPLPTSRCGEYDQHACYRGIATAVAEPLVLFKDPPAVTGTAAPVELTTDGDTVRIELSGLFAASDGGALTYTAVSDDPALATASVEGSILTVVSGADGGEGVVTIAVTATDADGLSVTLDLETKIEFVPRGLLRGWRRVLIDGAWRQPGEAQPEQGPTAGPTS